MSGSFRLYKSYSFKDKDPVIDRLRTIIADENVSYTEVHVLSDVAVSTMYNWFHGTTRRPTHATVAAVAGALGYDFSLVKRKGASKIVHLNLERAAKATAK
jgi:transcriptional regulator with XRE-family HTH domain